MAHNVDLFVHTRGARAQFPIRQQVMSSHFLDAENMGIQEYRVTNKDWSKSQLPYWYSSNKIEIKT